MPKTDLTRPIIGIENRTAQEVFDIMCDRFEAHLRTPATDTEAIRQIAVDLIDQRDEPDMFGLSYDRVHYWRDKAINAAARIDALAKGGA